MKSLAVAIVSGGMDSTTLAYMLRESHRDLHIVSFDYGQRHRKELLFAERTASKLGAQFTKVEMGFMAGLLKGSALTDDIPVPEGHYTAENMAVTVVPNRNAIMLAIAYGIAGAEEASVVGFAAHAGDHAIYPDCRPEFASVFEAMEVCAFGGRGPELTTPFIALTKAGIARIGWEYNVPFEDTWSCYVGGEKHCGRCGTCVERKEAFMLAEVIDPTGYEDPSFMFEAYRG